MTALLSGGHTNWSLDKDKDGHRTYKVSHIIKAASSDGPLTILNTPGLPVTGSTWAFGVETDAWAFCLPTKKVEPWQFQEGKGVTITWRVESTFSTKPIDRCQDTDIENPLFEPPKVSGSFIRTTIEAAQDRYGNAIKSSSHEVFRGPMVEFDDDKPTVTIEQNVADLQLPLLVFMVNTTNDAPLWGLDPGTIKLSSPSWTRKYYGTCFVYYTRTLQFDINFADWDRIIFDEGTKVLSGEWDTSAGCTGIWKDVNICGVAPDKDNPTHFIRYQDRRGNIARVLLDGAGKPITGTTPTQILIEYYDQSNFLLLGIPTIL